MKALRTIEATPLHRELLQAVKLHRFCERVDDFGGFGFGRRLSVKPVDGAEREREIDVAVVVAADVWRTAAQIDDVAAARGQCAHGEGTKKNTCHCHRTSSR